MFQNFSTVASFGRIQYLEIRMGSIVTLSITYQGNIYYLLVRPTPVSGRVSQFHVSLVATNLHSKIYERFIFEGNVDTMATVHESSINNTKELKETIMVELQNYLKNSHQ